VITIDLKALDRVLEVDPVSLAARIQAGATGPGLEQQLQEHGLTLRHYPQSFQFSTLGGWIATRAGGHFATLYTHIDDSSSQSGRSRRPARGRHGGCPPRARASRPTAC
jgi:alkyldihydroxyacetonephosphate synthase